MVEIVWYLRERLDPPACVIKGESFITFSEKKVDDDSQIAEEMFVK